MHIISNTIIEYVGLSKIDTSLLLSVVALLASTGACYITDNLAVDAPKLLQGSMLHVSSLYCVVFVGAFLVSTIVIGLVRLVMLLIPRSR